MILEKRIPIISNSLSDVPLKEYEKLGFLELDDDFIEEFYKFKNAAAKIQKAHYACELRDLTPEEELAFKYYCSDDIIEVLKDVNGNIHKFVLNEHLWNFVKEYLEYENTHSPGDGFWYIEGVKDE